MKRKSKAGRCPACGATLGPAESLCASCGKTLEAPDHERCGVCGAQYDPVLERCPICGAERELAPRGRASSLVTLALGLVALAVVIILGVRLRPWQNASLDPDRLVAAAMDRLGPSVTSSPSPVPPTPVPSATWPPTAIATMAPTLTPSLTLTPEPTLTPTSLQEPTAQPGTHVVQQGETPLRIAGIYGLTLEALLDANGLDDTAILNVGQVLQLPANLTGGSEAPPVMETVIHEVVAGDTLLGIAKSYGVDTADIAKANGISENAVLSVGQQLEIPVQRGGPVTATAAATADVARTPLTPPTPTPRPEVLKHTVAKGDTLGKIAVEYDVSAEEIAAANGFKVSAVLSIGKELLIPGLAPAASPTPQPSPTPTLTPTVAARAQAAAAAAAAPAYAFKYLPPQPLGPVDGASFWGESDLPLLSWASVGILAEDDWYRLRVWPATGAGEAQVVWTKSTSWRAAPELRSTERRELYWQVVVATQTEAGEVGVSLSAPSTRQAFVWR